MQTLPASTRCSCLRLHRSPAAAVVDGCSALETSSIDSITHTHSIESFPVQLLYSGSYIILVGTRYTGTAVPQQGTINNLTPRVANDYLVAWAHRSNTNGSPRRRTSRCCASAHASPSRLHGPPLERASVQTIELKAFRLFLLVFPHNFIYRCSLWLVGVLPPGALQI